MKAALQHLQDDLILEGFYGKTIFLDQEDDSDVIFHIYELSEGDPWLTIYQEYCSNGDVSRINIAGKESLEKLFELLKGVLKK